MNQQASVRIGEVAGAPTGSGGQLCADGNAMFSAIAPVPTTIEATGLSRQLLRDLMLKHIFEKSLAATRELCDSMGLSGRVVEALIQLLRDEALVEHSTAGRHTGEMCFRLTDRGRFEARDALARSGYAGVAPVPLEEYRRVVAHYSLLNYRVTRGRVDELFTGFVIDQGLLDRMGAALNSHRAIFVYGHAGTGKTYTISRLSRLYGDACLVPHAVASGETILQVFDPQLHKSLPDTVGALPSLRYAEAYDRRYVPSVRPVVIVGGELTLDQLEVNYEPETRLFKAPLQLQANNGLFIIDDMGRQAVPPKAIFNRWIVPMEERRDFLSLSNGQHFEAPFDVQLVFSSNINPLELADQAFLRRIGFKVMFEHIDGIAYTKIWRQELERAGIAFDPTIADYLVNELHRKNGVELAPCHPRDLLNTALAQIDYLSGERKLTTSLLDWAWSVYFVQLDRPDHAA